MKDCYQWIQDNWQLILLAFFFARNFWNNLLTNCPHLASNNTCQLIQGIFNSLIQAATKKLPAGQ